MPFDGIALYGTVHELRQLLEGNRITKIYQPNKHELVFFIGLSRKEYKLVLSVDPVNCRIHMADTVTENPSSPPMFCMLLRKYLLGGKIISISQKGLERIVEISISNTDEFMQLKEYKLIIEVMGKHSNIILTDSQYKIIDSIKRISFEVNRHREILPGKIYSNPPLEEKVDLISVDEDYVSIALKKTSASKEQKTLSKWILDSFAGFSGVSAQEIAMRANVYHKIPVSQLTDVQIEEIAKVFLRLRENLLQHNFEPHIYFNHKTKEPVDFWIFPMALYEKEHKLSENFTANEAVSIFYQHKRDVLAFKSLKESLKSQVVKHIKKTRQNLAYLEERLNKTSDLEKYKLWGDLLSANLYQIKPGQNQVLLPNFYNQNEKILIPLNEKLTPSHNAQIYFNRYKKLKATKEIVKKRINDALMEIEYLESTFLNIEQSKNIEDLSEILQELESQNYIKRTKQKRHKVEVSKPLRFKSSDGTIIYVGKNNRQNDFLTFKKSKPDDIWLHAKNTPGSHVIIETQGKVVSDETLTEAAILAAYFSNGRDSSNVPVDYTLVRHVKKPSGAKPGFVIYDRQKTLYVTPDEKTVNNLSL